MNDKKKEETCGLLSRKVGNFIYCIMRNNRKMINSGNIVVAIITKMNALLQEYGAKDIYKIPEGLHELCTDIAREVSPTMKLLFSFPFNTVTSKRN